MLCQLLTGHHRHEAISPGQFSGDGDPVFLISANNKDSSGSLGPLGLDLELEQPGDVLKDVLPGSVGTVNLEVVVGVDLLDLLDVQQIEFLT